MGKPRSKINSWSQVVDDLGQEKCRYMVQRRPESPYIQIIDKTNRKRFSLKPLAAWENMPDVLTAVEIIEWVGNDNWPHGHSVEQLLELARNTGASIGERPPPYAWSDVKKITFDYLTQSQKKTSAKNTKADLNGLVKRSPPFIWEDIKRWIFEKNLETRPFKNRLDSLEQIRLALSAKFANEPSWLKRADLDLLREQYNKAKEKSIRYQPNKEIGNIRGIPTKEEAENYLDELSPDFLLEQWCLAMILNYGLRNHELHHIGKITEENLEEGIQKNWIYIPGEWRTKSKYEHWSFPLYSSWITRYGLKNNFDRMQEKLRQKAKMEIASSLDKSKSWIPGNPLDLGVCQNNDYLGSWISQQLREVLPPWFAEIPDAMGGKIKGAQKQQIKPYDLRHTWAIRMATDPRCKGITSEIAAEAMGHDVLTHKKHYQRWISKKERQRKIMSKVTAPPEV